MYICVNNPLNASLQCAIFNAVLVKLKPICSSKSVFFMPKYLVCINNVLYICNKQINTTIH